MKINQLSTSGTTDSLSVKPTSFSLKPSSRLVVATSSPTRSQSHTQDTVNFSSNQTVASLAHAATQPSPSRSAKVQALKQAVIQGQYQLDSAKTAAALANAVV